MKPVTRLLTWYCTRNGHDWALPKEQRQFIPATNWCLRCGNVIAVLPWGRCLGGHKIAEHYNDSGFLVEHPTCKSGPQ